MRVLFISLEFPAWRQARSWSYAAHLGLEEGFRANNVDFMTIPAFHGIPAAAPASFLSRIRDLCSGRRFDQVWIELVHSPLDESLLEYVATLAPVRLGILGESLQYQPDIYAMEPRLRERRALVESRLRYMTHALVVDERDAEDRSLRKTVKAMWWTSAVPERFIREPAGPPPASPAAFCGAIYGVRSRWLEHPSLAGLLVRPSPPEDATPYPGLFDTLNAAMTGALQRGMAATGEKLEAYMAPLRRIRQECFSLWLDGLRSGCAVVNLQSFLQAYAGRVVEGMAAGRPVISWEIPDRPRNRALFRDGEEILLFPKDEPGVLAEHVRRLRHDPDLAERIVSNARRRIWRFHTSEKRIRQILDWVETGREPVYACSGEEESLGRKMQVFLSLLAGDAAVVESRPSADASGAMAMASLSLKAGDTDGAAGHLKEALRIRPEDPRLWLEVMRLAVMKDDDKTAGAALRKTLALCPTPADILPALESISANGSREIKSLVNRIKEDIYYENLFLKDPCWSSPAPNPDEQARWGKIRSFLDKVTNSSSNNGAPKPRILDLGCGRGWLANLASRYGRCEAIDPVSEVINVARRHLPHLRFHQGTARTILSGSDFTPYDIILSSEVIEHVPKSEQADFANDVFRLVKPGGHVILTTPRGEAYGAWKRATNFVDQPVEDWLTEVELCRLFVSQGFTPVGKDRIYINVATMTYVTSPCGEQHDSDGLLALYQVWAFERV
ncbi:MAG: methyltransferase domain-containing protein [Deltaproteobacteria bacterium]|nr:methyltransferase domain-containing protein [Deltaproteobacteria bacterium]